MTAGPAASRRVLARTPVAPLPASSPTRPVGINGRTSRSARQLSPRRVQLSVAKSVQFSVAIDTNTGTRLTARSYLVSGASSGGSCAASSGDRQAGFRCHAGGSRHANARRCP